MVEAERLVEVDGVLKVPPRQIEALLDALCTLADVRADRIEELEDQVKDFERYEEKTVLPLAAWCNDPYVSDAEYRNRARKLFLTGVENG
ncbi:MAG: hypothetical protein ACWGQW_11390 [bacterium]